MKTILIVLCLSLSMVVNAQTDCACCSDNHNAFNFWIGSWEVYNPDGTKAGENTITHLEEDCIISERWIGTKGTTGRSYNYYDTSDQSWNQLWLDNKGSILRLKGKASPGKMILKTDILTWTDGTKYYSQVTWTQNEDGTVRQLWEYLKEDGTIISTAFDGLYKPKVN